MALAKGIEMFTCFIKTKIDIDLRKALAKGIEMFTCFIKTKIDIDLRKRHFRVTPFLFII